MNTAGAIPLTFTKDTLPEAVRWLFESNGYVVEGPLHIHGAEFDLVATQLGGLRPTKTYIEVTIQYVDNTKYGLDLTKLAMVNREPGAHAVIISSVGFTPAVRERAREINVDTFTYDELFHAFEKMDPYLDSILGSEGELGISLAKLARIYEEPNFEDRHGAERATDYLTSWLANPDAGRPWIVVVGEYGTGKTALTRVLQHRWAELYKLGSGTPIPFRIELREFSRQFDARGLLHHFLDRNALGHVPVSFVESMISSGRVVLLLDGYDEMAQYLNVRERRACLEALADLAVDGARGILTSRPNYFSEAEELRVFEILYQQLSASPRTDKTDAAVLEDERRLDKTIERFLLERHERELRDLSPGQTEALIERSLGGDSEGSKVVTGLLNRLYRVGSQDSTRALSGKPVIVNYLLDVVAELKQDKVDLTNNSKLSEWQIFDLIVRNLMVRDFRRTPELIPSERRAFLQELALELSTNQAKSIGETDFRELVSKHFRQMIQRRTHEGSVDFADALADDLRSSATLTRTQVGKSYVWQFSHNSLREFFLVSRIVPDVEVDAYVDRHVPITEPMLIFARSIPRERLSEVRASIAKNWPMRRTINGLDQLLCLTWLALLDLANGNVRQALTETAGEGLDLSGSALSGISFSGSSALVDLHNANFAHTELTELDLSKSSLLGANFRNAWLDGCSFREADLAGADFGNSLLIDCDLTQANLKDSLFRSLDRDSSAFVSGREGTMVMSGQLLMGYLNARGALTDPVDDYFAYVHHPAFDIVDKIVRNLAGGGWSQRLGLELRGSSQKNPALARRFVSHLLSEELLERKYGKSALVRPNAEGRASIHRFIENQEFDEAMSRFFASEKS